MFQLRKTPLTHFQSETGTVNGLNVNALKNLRYYSVPRNTCMISYAILSTFLVIQIPGISFLRKPCRYKENSKRKPDNPHVKLNFYEKTQVDRPHTGEGVSPIHLPAKVGLSDVSPPPTSTILQSEHRSAFLDFLDLTELAERCSDCRILRSLHVKYGT